MKTIKVTQKMVDYIESHREEECGYCKDFYLVLGEEIFINDIAKDYSAAEITILDGGGGCRLPAEVFDFDLAEYARKLRLEKERKEVNKNTDWNDVRIKASISAMQTLVNLYNAYDEKEAARKAVKYADALVEELQKV